MIRRIKKYIQHLVRDETGSASVEFVLVVPVFISLIVMSAELSLVTLRHSLLQRGLDIAVRELRLGTNQNLGHDVIKESICDNALFISDCSNNLILEMTPANIRAFNSFSTPVTCIDRSEETRPVLEFTPGQQNELVILRACLIYDPLFPEELLGKALTSNGANEASIISTTAFVQEPL